MTYTADLEKELEDKLIACPSCGEILELSISPCTDFSCCGIEHRINCSSFHCKYEKESFDLEDLVDEHRRLI